MSQTPNTAIAVIGIDIGKNSFHVVGHDARGAIVLRQKWSRGRDRHWRRDVFSKGRDFGAWLGLVPKQISTAASAWSSEPNTMVNTTAKVRWKRPIGSAKVRECSAIAAATQGCVS